MTVVSVGRDNGIALFLNGLDAGNDSFLTDVKMAEAANQAHSVELTCLLFEAADQNHVTVELLHLFSGQIKTAVGNGGQIRFL